MSELLKKKGKRKGMTGENLVISENQDQELSSGQKLSSAALGPSTSSEPSEVMSNSSQNCTRGKPTSRFGEERSKKSMGNLWDNLSTSIFFSLVEQEFNAKSNMDKSGKVIKSRYDISLDFKSVYLKMKPRDLKDNS